MCWQWTSYSVAAKYLNPMHCLDDMITSMQRAALVFNLTFQNCNLSQVWYFKIHFLKCFMRKFLEDASWGSQFTAHVTVTEWCIVSCTVQSNVSIWGEMRHVACKVMVAKLAQNRLTSECPCKTHFVTLVRKPWNLKITNEGYGWDVDLQEYRSHD